MSYLLDTNACIQYLNASNNRILAKMSSLFRRVEGLRYEDWESD